jgi:hypothetical protein
LGVPSQFNWRNHPQIANVNKTIQTFREAMHNEMPGLRECGHAA